MLPSPGLLQFLLDFDLKYSRKRRGGRLFFARVLCRNRSQSVASSTISPGRDENTAATGLWRASPDCHANKWDFKRSWPGITSALSCTRFQCSVSLVWFCWFFFLRRNMEMLYSGKKTQFGYFLMKFISKVIDILKKLFWWG